MINSDYSNIDIYHQYKSGTPISEIVEKTGVKRKTWNKRFERLEKKHKVATNNNKRNIYLNLINHELIENNIGDNSAIINNKNGDKTSENVAITNSFDPKEAIEDGKNDKNDFLAWLVIALFLIGLILLFKWIYDNYIKRNLVKKKG